MKRLQAAGDGREGPQAAGGGRQGPQAAGDGPQEIAACPDPETMAAWMDGGLMASQIAQVEAHVAGCQRCQAVAAAMVRTEVVSAPAPVAARPSRRWLGWFLPLTAAAAAAVILFVTLPREVAREQSKSVAEPQQQADSRLKQEAANEAAPPAALKDEHARVNQARDEEARGRRRADANRPVQNKDLDRAATGKVAAVREGADKPAAVGETVVLQKPLVTGPPPAAAAAPPPARRAEVLDGVARQELRAAAVTSVLQILSSDPKVLWRAGGLMIERTMDGGRSWTVTPTGVAEPITAGASPAPSICWLVGRGGVVLRTTDGEKWQRVAFPEKTDLSAVSAVDAQRATVTTADGRTFTTTDGGATWKSTSLQETSPTPF